MCPLLIYLLLLFSLILSTLNTFKNKTFGPWTICTLFLWAGLACILCFLISESTVDAEGVLHEQFGFLPIGFGLMFMGMLGELLRIILNLHQRKV